MQANMLKLKLDCTLQNYNWKGLSFTMLSNIYIQYVKEDYLKLTSKAFFHCKKITQSTLYSNLAD